MEHKTVAIHQPNFLPWLGFFNKIAKADVFCFMDNVQLQKTGGSWTNRVRMAINDRATWVTVPIDRGYSGTRDVRDVRVAADPSWRTKILKTIRSAYGRARFFDDLFPLLEECLGLATDRLAELNEHAIRRLCEVLGLDDTVLARGSDLDAEGDATDLLIAMTRELGGNAYLCGGGASGYQDDDRFRDAGVGLVYQTFEHPVYPQPGVSEFIAGLSVVDAIMHCGFAETGRLVRGDR
ncbi:MAG: WbqC family protein [Planctomycetes bacterium]|nr:WbqC family protein [Planctomycetota bacterium]